MGINPRLLLGATLGGIGGAMYLGRPMDSPPSHSEPEGGTGIANAIAGLFAMTGPTNEGSDFINKYFDEGFAMFGHLPCYELHVGENAKAGVSISRNDEAMHRYLGMLPDTPLAPKALDMAKTIEGWEDYYNHVRPRYRLMKQECGCLPTYGRILTESLSRSLTTYAGLKAFGLTDKDVITVHVLGAARAETLNADRVFAELAYLLPKSTINITSVGPDVHGSASQSSIAAQPSSSPSPTTSSSSTPNMTTKHLKGSYHSLNVEPKPDLVVAFHPGFHLYPEWQPTLKMLLSKRIPVVITAFNRDDMQHNYDSLMDSHSEVSVKFGPTLNPFHSQCYLPPFVSNSYSMGFQGRRRWWLF